MKFLSLIVFCIEAVDETLFFLREILSIIGVNEFKYSSVTSLISFFNSELFTLATVYKKTLAISSAGSNTVSLMISSLVLKLSRYIGVSPGIELSSARISLNAKIAVLIFALLSKGITLSLK